MEIMKATTSDHMLNILQKTRFIKYYSHSRNRKWPARTYNNDAILLEKGIYVQFGIVASNIGEIHFIS